MKRKKLSLKKVQVSKLNNLNLIKGGSTDFVPYTSAPNCTDTGGGGQTDDSILDTYDDNEA